MLFYFQMYTFCFLQISKLNSIASFPGNQARVCRWCFRENRWVFVKWAQRQSEQTNKCNWVCLLSFFKTFVASKLARPGCNRHWPMISSTFGYCIFAFHISFPSSFVCIFLILFFDSIYPNCQTPKCPSFARMVPHLTDKVFLYSIADYFISVNQIVFNICHFCAI